MPESTQDGGGRGREHKSGEQSNAGWAGPPLPSEVVRCWMDSSCEVQASPFGLLTQLFRSSLFISPKGDSGGMKGELFLLGTAFLLYQCQLLHGYLEPGERSEGWGRYSPTCAGGGATWCVRCSGLWWFLFGDVHISFALPSVLTSQHPGRGGERSTLVAFSPSLLSICSNSAERGGWGAFGARVHVLALLQRSGESLNKDLWFHVNTNVFMMTNSAACLTLNLFIQSWF